MCVQWWINRALDNALQEAQRQDSLPLRASDRYVILSDLHRGARTAADDFQVCEPAYRSALGYYLEEGYTLIQLGDVDELWEESDPGRIMSAYPEVLTIESQFHRNGRYVRIVGNHDNVWSLPWMRRRYLSGLFPDLAIRETLLFEGDRGTGSGRRIFLVHGHQGTFDSYIIAPLSRFFVRFFWRTYQILTGKGRSSPATDLSLRGKHDNRMYRWAEKKGTLILIAGHTHRPIWASKTHLERLLDRLGELEARSAGERLPDYEEVASRLKQEIAKRGRDRAHNETVKSEPCYFNTGCCCFEDGDITGIEIADGRMSLVKWGKTNGGIQRTVMEFEDLALLLAGV